jgi:hypothetical protein
MVSLEQIGRFTQIAASYRIASLYSRNFSMAFSPISPMNVWKKQFAPWPVFIAIRRPVRFRAQE